MLCAAPSAESRADPIPPCPLNIKRVFNPQGFICTKDRHKNQWKKDILGPFPPPFFTPLGPVGCVRSRLSPPVPCQPCDLIQFPGKRLEHIFRCSGLFLARPRGTWGGKGQEDFLHHRTISVSGESTQMNVRAQNCPGLAGLAPSI